MNAVHVCVHCADQEIGGFLPTTSFVSFNYYTG